MGPNVLSENLVVKSLLSTSGLKGVLQTLGKHIEGITLLEGEQDSLIAC